VQWLITAGLYVLHKAGRRTAAGWKALSRADFEGISTKLNFFSSKAQQGITKIGVGFTKNEVLQ